MEEKICQSCSMPLGNEMDCGTNADGTISQDYCKHCYEKGAFIGYQTLEEAIADSANYAEHAGMSKEAMVEMQSKVLPTLKRWRCTCTDECASGHNPNCTCASPECRCAE